MLSISTDQKEEVNKMPTKEDFNRAVGSKTVNSKKIREFYHLNEVAFDSVNHKSTTEKMHFNLLKIARQKSILKENCHLAWTCLIDKYAPRLAFFLLAHKKQLKNSRLKSLADDPEVASTQKSKLLIEQKVSLVSTVSAKMESNLPNLGQCTKNHMNNDDH